jgi:hypothetical protein
MALLHCVHPNESFIYISAESRLTGYVATSLQI